MEKYGCERTWTNLPSLFVNEKRMGAEVPADSLGPEFAGYVLRLTGGNDKQYVLHFWQLVLERRTDCLTGVQGFPHEAGCSAQPPNPTAPVQGPLVLPTPTGR